MRTRQDLIDEWIGMIWELKTRTFCRPEHLAGYDERLNRLAVDCRISGFEPADIEREAMQQEAECAQS